jgi:hypothetical protein
MAANPKAQIQLLKELAKAQSDQPTIDALNFAVAWLESAMPWTVDKARQYTLTNPADLIELRDELVRLDYQKVCGPGPDDQPGEFTYCDLNNLDEFYAMLLDEDSSIWSPEYDRYSLDYPYETSTINDQLEMRLTRRPFYRVSISPINEE